MGYFFFFFYFCIIIQIRMSYICDQTHMQLEFVPSVVSGDIST